MCAADMCEGVLAHARGYFSRTVHVLSATPTRQRYTEASAKNSDPAGNISVNNLMIIGDSKLACAAREAKALHGMLLTIHEVRSLATVCYSCVLCAPASLSLWSFFREGDPALVLR